MLEKAEKHTCKNMCRIEKKPHQIKQYQLFQTSKKKVPLHRYIELPPKITLHVADAHVGQKSGQGELSLND